MSSGALEQCRGDAQFISMSKNQKTVLADMPKEESQYMRDPSNNLEAMIYILEGEGYSEVQGRNEPWKGGDLLHVPPAMFEHEHYNDSPLLCKQLRIQFGIRFWFTDIWPTGYTSQRIYDKAGQPIVAGAMRK